MVTRNETEAGTWYRKAADQSFPEAQDNLGSCYAQGRGVPQDSIEALAGIAASPIRFSMAGQHHVALAYWQGKGTAQDYAESVRWFGKAADQGGPVAKEFLGDAYRQGLGVPQDFAKAVKWYCAAADDDSAPAMGKCGYALLIGGPGVAPDRVESLKWLTLAVERGSGETHDRGAVNLRQALAQATAQDVTDAARRAEEMRTKWRIR